jgi:HEAT repeat protein
MLTSEEDRDAARAALREIDSVGPEALPVLKAALTNEDRRRRFFAVYLLGKLGPEAKEVLPELRAMQAETESDSRFRTFLESTIAKIEGRDVPEE